MKIFLSWSGDRSKAVATALRSWVPDIIQTVQPWMSQVDIGAGSRWSGEMNAQMEEAKFGVLCLTRDNQTAPWILFEAGALAKTISDSFVCPYLIDLEPTEILQGPLTQFQSKRANEKETWELIQAINKALKDAALPNDKLKRAFDRWFPDLKEKLDSLLKEQTGAKQDRPIEEMVEEMLGLVREMTRHQTDRRSMEDLNEKLWRLTKSVDGLPSAIGRIEMGAEARHKYRVGIERLIRSEVLAVLRTAEMVRKEMGNAPDADASHLTTSLIEVLQTRIKNGEIDAKLVPQF